MVGMVVSEEKQRIERRASSHMSRWQTKTAKDLIKDLSLQARNARRADMI